MLTIKQMTIKIFRLFNSLNYCGSISVLNYLHIKDGVKLEKRHYIILQKQTKLT